MASYHTNIRKKAKIINETQSVIEEIEEEKEPDSKTGQSNTLIDLMKRSI